MADDTLSFTGKNVKVITVGNKVTLRGPVKTDQAKLAIAAIATRTPGVNEVDNQLEVKN
jgi:osmotically-inducible protein OsmY